MQVRDRLGQWLRDEEFAAAFGIRGRPGWSPSRLALVTVLQRAQKLTDRQAHPAWLEQRVCVADWDRRYGTPMTSWRPPQSEARREELAIAYARDGYALLEAVYDPSSPAVAARAPGGRTCCAGCCCRTTPGPSPAGRR